MGINNAHLVTNNIGRGKSKRPTSHENFDDISNWISLHQMRVDDAFIVGINLL